MWILFKGEGTRAGLVAARSRGHSGDHRDNQTIGTGNHYQEFRLILWKGKNPMFW
ncbi:hypothetical protein [Desertivirga brevis]|uniref:hypothetical protein n=1 Tax=Desertivirga brevis TaxID=2810310 RepID=UPI001A96B594|nr:hypothetical protein [Pedobacter sp. SYSU D00873]